MKLLLEISTTPDNKRSFEHSGATLNIGRDSSCDLALPDGGQVVSSKHARIEMTPDGAYVRDLESSNGTFVNDRRIDKRTGIKEGDYIRLGQSGPYLKLTSLDLTGAFKKVSVPKPAMAPSPPPAPFGMGQFPPRATLATRVKLALIESRYRKVWLWSGVGVTCAVLGITVILVLQGGRIGQVIAENKGFSQQADDLQHGIDQTKKELAEFLAGDAETIRRRNGEAVFVVATKSGSFVKLLATAFAIRSDGKLGTNAHVTVVVDKWLKEGKQIWAISPGAKHEYEVVGAHSHPKYIHWVGGKIVYQTPDVGVLTVRIPGGGLLPAIVDLAADDDLRQLSPGAQLCYVGFPGWDGLRTYPSLTKIEPRIYVGVLTRLTTLKEESGEFSNQHLLEHDMSNIGGASGSPIFNKQGKVVAVHNSGKGADVLTPDGVTDIPFGPNLGIRVDLLRELLK